MKYLTESELNKLSTKRLLAYKRKQFPSPDVPHATEDYIWSCECSSCVEEKTYVAEYRKQYELVKKVLNTREHEVKRNAN
jgi:hypothetical protein